MVQAIDWALKMLTLALSPGRPEGAGLPPIVCYDELETMPQQMWLGIENLLVANDRWGHASVPSSLQPDRSGCAGPACEPNDT